MSALDHKYNSAQFEVVCVLYMTFWLEKSLYAACQKCILHKPFLVSRSMEIILPYSLCVVALAHQNSVVQIWNATTKIHPELMFEMQPENRCYYFLYCQGTRLLLYFLPWMQLLYCLPFMLGTILNGSKQLLVIGTFSISWSLGCLSLITQWSSSM